MDAEKALEEPRVNLNNCDREPVHLIGTAQSHGLIMACDLTSLQITHCSGNSLLLIGYPHGELLGKPLSDLLPAEKYERLKTWLQKPTPLFLDELGFQDRAFLMIPHISGNRLILELEPKDEQVSSLLFQEQLSGMMKELSAAADVAGICNTAVNLVKEFHGYDRVMLYKFDDEWNGEVIAEAREPKLEAWLGLHYPATDIPKPARDLFLKQKVRMISDVQEPASAITAVSADEPPLDLSASEVRGVSPIHIEYLKNMGVAASITAAIIVEGNLWGLFACHHYSPKFTGYHKRQSVAFLSKVFSGQLALRTGEEFLKKIEKAAEIRRKLARQMASVKNIPEALRGGETAFTDIIDSGGGAICLNGELYLAGETPNKEEVRLLLEYLYGQQKKKIFYSRKLSQVFSEAEAYRDKASGLLSVRLGEQTEDRILWFRPEERHTVNWGGKPQKAEAVKDGIAYLSPRKSFEKWEQQVSGVALPWKAYELEAAIAFSEDVLHALVQQQKEEITELNRRLRLSNEDLKTFSYSVSHDLSAPLRGISGFAAILNDHYLESLDPQGREAVKAIVRSSGHMKMLIRDMLELSGIGKSEMQRRPFSVEKLAEESLQFLGLPNQYPETSFSIKGSLPEAEGDPRMAIQLLNNLLGNAFKYSARASKPVVEMGFKDGFYYIRDNGIGFDPRLQEKMFRVFSRLVGEEYSGTGVGLAIVKKITDRHGGEIKAVSSPGEGATFYFNFGKKAD